MSGAAREIQEGRAFVFGDGIDTDLLAPGGLMKLPPEELARHCLEAVAPDFAASVQPGDYVVAGRNFGLGSSREQAAASLKFLGVGAVIAHSFARIFYRNAINLGLPAVVSHAVGDIRDGDRIALDLVDGRLENRTSGQVFAVAPLAPALSEILNAGGLMPLLERRFEASRLRKD